MLESGIKWFGAKVEQSNDMYFHELPVSTSLSFIAKDDTGLISVTEFSSILSSIVPGTGLSGTSLTGPAVTLNVDASIPEITTLAGLTSFGSAGATTNILSDATFYQPVNNADPGISIGASDDERLQIDVLYQGTTTQTAQIVSFASFTESAVANDGRFHFSVDGTFILKIQDAGIDLSENMGITSDGNNILSDSSGTMTLSNIDALDATTISTLNAALTAGDITGVTAGTNLSGGGTSGAVTINLADASTSAKGAASFSSDNFAASSGAITIKPGGVDLTAEVTGVLPSANMDGDTAHLAGAQTFTGGKTFANGIILDGNRTLTPGDGAFIHQDTAIITDGDTSASGTAALFSAVNIEGARLAATNSSVTTTAAASLYIKAAPTPSTNQTITNAYALWVDDGAVLFDGALTVGGTITGDVTGDLTGQADTVATIAGLAPNTATTQATQNAITTLSGVTSIGAAAMAITSGSVTQYKAVNDGNPVYSVGSSDSNELKIQAVYHSGAQTLETVLFRSETAGTSANDGKMIFQVDTASILQIDDGGIDFVASHGISIAGTDILTDSSGTATLSNIDALDATTKTTIATTADAATATATGVVELATTAEAITGTDTARAVTPAGLKARVSQIVNLKGYAVLQNDVFDYANAYNTDDEAPFQLDVSYGSGTIDSSTEVAQSKLFRSGGFHVPFACTVSGIQAQLTCNNDGNVSIALVEYRPSDAGGDANDHPRTVYETVVVDSENNNNKVSSTTIATGDLDNTAIPAGSHLMIMVKGDGTSVGGTAVFSVAIGLSW